MADVRENFIRGRETSLERNVFWANELAGLYIREADPLALLTLPASIESLTPAMVHEAAVQYFNMDNYLRMTLLPEERQGR